VDTQYCDHSEDAGVVCLQSNVSSTNNTVRLEGHPKHPNMGRVEIKLGERLHPLQVTVL
jgi:hypothetical protein